MHACTALLSHGMDVAPTTAQGLVIDRNSTLRAAQPLPMCGCPMHAGVALINDLRCPVAGPRGGAAPGGLRRTARRRQLWRMQLSRRRRKRRKKAMGTRLRTCSSQGSGSGTAAALGSRQQRSRGRQRSGGSRGSSSSSSSRGSRGSQWGKMRALMRRGTVRSGRCGPHPLCARRLCAACCLRCLPTWQVSRGVWEHDAACRVLVSVPARQCGQ